MAAVSKLRLEFATAGFLLEMRKQFAKMHPDRECSIKNLVDYPLEQRSALMAGLGRAIQYAGEDGDKAFAVWIERRLAAAEKDQAD